MKSIIFICLSLMMSGLSFSQNKSAYKIHTESYNLYKQAKYQKAIDISEATLNKMASENSKEYLTLFNLYYTNALCNTELSKYKKAIKQYEAAIKIAKKQKYSIYYFVILPNYSIALSRSGRKKDALKTITNCINEYEKQTDKRMSVYAKMLNVAGVINFEINKYQQSIEYLEKAKEIYETKLKDKGKDYKLMLANLAMAYNAAGKNKKADAIYEANNNKKLETKNDSIEYATNIANYANYLKDIGDYKQAYTLLLKSKEMTEKLHGKKSFEYSLILGNLGVFLTNINNREAESLLIENVKLRAEIYGTDHLMYATSLNNLGNLYNYTENYSMAERLYLECLKIREKKLGKNNAMYANIVHNLAFLYSKTNRYNKALHYYKESLRVNEKTLGKRHYEYRNNLKNICNLYWEMNKPDSAELFFKITDDLHNKDIISNFSYLTEKQKENYLIFSSDFYKTFMAFAYERKNKNKAIVGDIYNDELMLKGIILSSNNAMRNAIEASSNPELKKTHKNLLKINEKLNKIYSTPKNERTQNVDSLEKIASQKEKEVNKLMEINGLQKFLQNKVTWRDIKKRLKRNEVAIEFCNFKKYNKAERTDSVIYCALILKKRSRYPKMIYLFEEKQMKSILKKPEGIENDYYYIDPIYKITPKKITKSDSLFNLIWKPIMPHIKGAKRIFLSPTGILHGVSFAAIPINNKILITDKYELIYLSNTKNILSIPKKSKFSNISVYGGIDYDFAKKDSVKTNKSNKPNKNRNISWNYLEGSLTEADTISEMFTEEQLNVNLLTDINATEESFKSLNNNSPTVIHVATHGFFFPDSEREKWTDLFGDISFITSNNPLLRSGLLFAGGSDAWNGIIKRKNSEDGVLTAYEISNLNLSNSKLVVLSACQTGLGKVTGTEGVYGLRRAFKMSGVDYLITSLWSIPDKQTTELMTLFYIKLLKSKDIPGSFHEAQQELRKKYPAFGWAAFVLIY